MPVRKLFGSDISLDSLVTREKEFKPARIEKQDSFCTLETEPGSQSSLDCSELSEGLPKGILKRSTSHPSSLQEDVDERLQAWMNQPIPENQPSTGSPSRRRRQRSSTATSTNKYDRVKTQFPGRECRREESSMRVRRRRPQKTPEEQWVKTCRFLW